MREQYYRKNDEVIFSGERTPIANLDDLPMPAWHLYNIKDYYGKGTSEEEVRKTKKELEKILNNLYSNNYEYEII